MLDANQGGVVLGDVGEFDLATDERRSSGVTLLFECVGVNESQGVIVRVLQDRPEQSFTIRHNIIPGAKLIFSLTRYTLTEPLDEHPTGFVAERSFNRMTSQVQSKEFIQIGRLGKGQGSNIRQFGIFKIKF